MGEEPIPETSPSGQPVFRHSPREKPFEFAVGDESHIEAIGTHVERHVGKADTVFHEIISDLVHIDVHVVKPTEQRPFTTLVTSGMSAKPMRTPEGSENISLAELAICLPPEWPLSEEAFKNEDNYWPIRWLKMLARLPHEYDTWLSYGHTVPNGDPPERFAGNTQFCCLMLSLPRMLPREFVTLHLDHDRTVYFYVVLPLYKEEVDLKLRKGIDFLEKLLFKVHATEVLDLKRDNAGLLPWWRRMF